MDPLKALAATVFCLVLFGLVFRLTRRLMEMAIAAGHAEARRRADEEAVSAEAPPLGAEPAAAGSVSPPAVQAAGAVP